MATTTAKTIKIDIEPLTRIEGHLGIHAEADQATGLSVQRAV